MAIPQNTIASQVAPQAAQIHLPPPLTPGNVWAPGGVAYAVVQTNQDVYMTGITAYVDTITNSLNNTLTNIVGHNHPCFFCSYVPWGIKVNIYRFMKKIDVVSKLYESICPPPSSLIKNYMVFSSRLFSLSFFNVLRMKSSALSSGDNLYIHAYIFSLARPLCRLRHFLKAIES